MDVNFDDIFSQIKDIVIKTCISSDNLMIESINRERNHRNNCFELYGFDIIVDNKLKAWLLEVNVCPSLSCSSPLDKRIKTSLISDIIHLLGF